MTVYDPVCEIQAKVLKSKNKIIRISLISTNDFITIVTFDIVLKISRLSLQRIYVVNHKKASFHRFSMTMSIFSTP